MTPGEVVVNDNQILWCRKTDNGTETRDAVSNFSLRVLRSIHVDSDAGGPGLLVEIRRYPDDTKQ